MGRRRRAVTIIPTPAMASDALEVLSDVVARYSDARLEITDGQLAVTTAGRRQPQRPGSLWSAQESPAVGDE